MTDAQIKSAFEVIGMTPAQIADESGFDVTAIKAKLMQVSTVFRNQSRKESDEEDELNFSNDELRAMNKIIVDIATSAQHPDGSPDFKTMLQAAVYVRDDKKGRKEVRNTMANMGGLNIFHINTAIQAAKNGSARLKEAVESRMIEA